MVLPGVIHSSYLDSGTQPWVSNPREIHAPKEDTTNATSMKTGYFL
jgi:hypothetical protein